MKTFKDLKVCDRVIAITDCSTSVDLTKGCSYEVIEERSDGRFALNDDFGCTFLADRETLAKYFKLSPSQSTIHTDEITQTEQTKDKSVYKINDIVYLFDTLKLADDYAQQLDLEEYYVEEIPVLTSLPITREQAIESAKSKLTEEELIVLGLI